MLTLMLMAQVVVAGLAEQQAATVQMVIL